MVGVTHRSKSKGCIEFRPTLVTAAVGLLVMAAIIANTQFASLLGSSSSLQQQHEWASGASSAPPFSMSDEDWNAFIDTFQAANPSYTEQCRAYLRSPADYNDHGEGRAYINWNWHFSQYNQDWFTFRNFFLESYIKNSSHKGFYIESGANDPIRVSNTAFYDYCLGWDGLCIEPLPRYHDYFTGSSRTCELVKNCLSSVDNEKIFIDGTEIPGGDSGVEVTCMRLDSILKDRGISHVDLWSLDVEGFEHQALQGVNWTSVQFQSILMEQQELTSGPCTQISIDYRLTTLGYYKYRIVSDAFYWKGPGSVLFPNVESLDEYFLELETNRCKEKYQAEVKFFY